MRQRLDSQPHFQDTDSRPAHLWFRAKSYGWGWYPATWQGWGVLVMYIFSVIDRAVRLSMYPQTTIDVWTEFVLQVYILTVFLIIICYATGEKPGWRWGNRSGSGTEEVTRGLTKFFSYFKRHAD